MGTGFYSSNHVTVSREERLARWYNNAKIGLFVHWGFNTGNPDYQISMKYTSAEQFEKAAGNAGWDAGKWVEMARKLHADYITVAAFHSCLGYVTIWPSAIPGCPHTSRDFLGELINAAEAEGIKIVVYITSDPLNNYDWPGLSWLDNEAYCKYKGKFDLDITTTYDFQTWFCKDIIDELLTNYPEIAGFWFDGWNNRKICEDLFAHIHARNPWVLTIRNNFDDGPFNDEDVMSLENMGKRHIPDFDLASGTWVPPGKGVELCFAAIGNWTYRGVELPKGSNAECIKKIISVIGNDWVAHIGFGPKIGGEFPEAINDFANHIDSFLLWAGESVFGTIAGGYANGGFQPGNWGYGAYGVTTLKPDSNIHYLHVLRKAENNVLELPDGGYTVTCATDLKTGELLEFKQENGMLTIHVPSWETVKEIGDMVIKLETAGSAKVLNLNEMFNLSCGDLKSCLTFDGECSDPKSMVLDLGKEIKIRGLKILQAETSAVSSGGWGAPDSERINEYELYICSDNKWKQVKKGSLYNQRGFQYINISPVDARYIKFTVLNCYNTNTAGNSIKKWNNRWEPFVLPGIKEDIVSITADKEGRIWTILEDGRIRRYYSGMWSDIPGNARYITVGRDNSVLAVSDEKILRWNGIEWADTGCKGVKATTALNGDIWYIDNESKIYRCSKDRIACIGGTAVDITAAEDGSVWKIGSEELNNANSLYKWDGDVWEKIELPVEPVQIYYRNEKHFWILTRDHKVFGLSRNAANCFIIGHGASSVASGYWGELWMFTKPVYCNPKVVDIQVILY